MMEWIQKHYLESEDKAKEHKLLTYIFQCNSLPPADYNGLSDP